MAGLLKDIGALAVAHETATGAQIGIKAKHMRRTSTSLSNPMDGNVYTMLMV